MQNTIISFNSAFESSQYFNMVILDANDCISQCNTKFKNELLFFVPYVIGSAFSDYIFPEDFSKYRKLLETALAEKKSNFSVDLRKLTLDGSDLCWTRWEFSLDYLDSGTHVAVGIGHKIQKPKDINFDLPGYIEDSHIKQEVMDGLLEENLIGFWLWNFTNQKDQLSTSLLQMLGYNLTPGTTFPSDVNWKKHVHPFDIQKVDEILSNHLESKGIHPFHCEFRICSNDNTEKWVLGYGKVVDWLESGSPAIMVGGFFDISEKKESEDKLQKQHDFLKNLTFDQSHTMRAKLANIKGILEVLDPKAKDREISHLVKMLKSEAEHLDKALKKSIANTVRMEYSTTK